mgnify:CR=1 FL=1
MQLMQEIMMNRTFSPKFLNRIREEANFMQKIGIPWIESAEKGCVLSVLEQMENYNFLNQFFIQRCHRVKELKDILITFFDDWDLYIISIIGTFLFNEENVKMVSELLMKHQ